MSFPDISEAAALPGRSFQPPVPGHSDEDSIDLADVEYHDYTDGAPAAAIQLVLDEQELQEHGEGAMGGGGDGDDESKSMDWFPP